MTDKEQSAGEEVMMTTFVSLDLLIPLCNVFPISLNNKQTPRSSRSTWDLLSMYHGVHNMLPDDMAVARSHLCEGGDKERRLHCEMIGSLPNDPMDTSSSSAL